jgi:hypothetical protein
MNFEELEAKLVRLMSFPIKSQIKIDFEEVKKTIFLSVAIYRSGGDVPDSLRKYVQAREGMTFKPHKTSFQIENKTVRIVQELPLKQEYQESLRQLTHEFWDMAKSCHQMMMEIAAEENLSEYDRTP